MDDTNQPLPVAPPLEYAPQPSVGDFSLSRADGVTTITARPSWRAAIWSLFMGFIPPLLSFISIAICWVITSRQATPPVMIGFFVFLLLGLAGCHKQLIFALAGHKWTVDAQGILFTGRQATSIVQQRFPRAMVADLCVERRRIKNQSLWRLGISIVKPDGHRVVILRRSRDELQFVCQAMRTALDLPEDPLGALQYPKISRFSRIQHRLLADGVAMTLRPSRFGPDGLLIAIACFAGFFAADYWILQSRPFFHDEATATVIGLFRVTLLGILSCAILLLIRYHLRRAISLTWSASTLHLSERSLFTPAAISWPGVHIDSIRVDRPAGSRRSSLVLHLKDGTQAVLISNQPCRDVKLIEAILKTGMGLRPAVGL